MWSVISFSIRPIFNVSLSEVEDWMLKELLYHVTNNTGPFLMVTGILGIIVMIILSRLGVINMLLEKIDEIGGFNKFRITPHYFAHDFVSEKGSARFTIVIQVKNIGFNKSNLNEWSLYFITKDGKNFSAVPLYQKDTIYINYNNGIKFSYPADKALYKLTQKSLDLGESVTGVIQFAIPGFSEEMFNENCTIILKAKDNKDKKIKFETTLKIFYERKDELIAELHDIAVNQFTIK